MTVVVEDQVEEGAAICPQAVSYVSDPSLSDTVETAYEHVPGSNVTTGPNRYTVHVPSENSVLSLGAASPSRWVTDLGIVGYTNRHIHFETKTSDKTIVSLGEAATRADIEAHGGIAPKTDATHGYVMITAQRSWHQANGQHYLVSHTADVSLRTISGKRAVVQAENGAVDLNAGKEASLSAPGITIGAAEGITFEDVDYEGTFKGHAAKSAAASTAKLWIDILSGAVSAHDVGLKFIKTAKKIKDKKSAFSNIVKIDTVKWGLDVAKLVLSIGKIKDALQKVEPPDGTIKLNAQKDVIAVAGKDVGITAGWGVSLGSGVATTVAAGAIATMKGGLFAGIGSALSSMKAARRLEIIANWGDVILSAAKNVELTGDEHFRAGGKTGATVVGTKRLLLGGKTRVWIGSGQGFGMLFDDKGVAFGKAEGVENMASAKVAATPAVRIDDGKIELKSSGATVTLSDTGAVLEAPKIRIDAGPKNVSLAGATVIFLK